MNKQFVAELLRREGSFFVHLDPRAKGVEVPPWLRHQEHLVLQFGDDLPIKIQDFEISRDWIVGTLSFSRTPFRCSIPWSAVFGIVGENGRGMIWEDSAPAGVLREAKASKTSLPWPEPTKKSGLRSVPDCGSRKGPPRKGHLKLVR